MSEIEIYRTCLFLSLMIFLFFSSIVRSMNVDRKLNDNYRIANMIFNLSIQVWLFVLFNVLEK